MFRLRLSDARFAALAYSNLHLFTLWYIHMRASIQIQAQLPTPSPINIRHARGGTPCRRLTGGRSEWEANARIALCLLSRRIHRARPQAFKGLASPTHHREQTRPATLARRVSTHSLLADHCDPSCRRRMGNAFASSPRNWPTRQASHAMFKKATPVSSTPVSSAIPGRKTDTPGQFQHTNRQTNLRHKQDGRIERRATRSGQSDTTTRWYRFDASLKGRTLPPTARSINLGISSLSSGELYKHRMLMYNTMFGPRSDKSNTQRTTTNREPPAACGRRCPAHVRIRQRRCWPRRCWPRRGSAGAPAVVARRPWSRAVPSPCAQHARTPCLTISDMKQRRNHACAPPENHHEPSNVPDARRPLYPPEAQEADFQHGHQRKHE